MGVWRTVFHGELDPVLNMAKWGTMENRDNEQNALAVNAT